MRGSGVPTWRPAGSCGKVEIALIGGDDGRASRALPVGREHAEGGGEGGGGSMTGPARQLAQGCAHKGKRQC